MHHTFLYISLPFLHDYVRREHSNFVFYGERQQATTKFYVTITGNAERGTSHKKRKNEKWEQNRELKSEVTDRARVQVRLRV